MDFLSALKKGVEASRIGDHNQQEIDSVFQELETQINQFIIGCKTKKLNGHLIIYLTDKKLQNESKLMTVKSHPTTGYPVRLRAYSTEFLCNKKNELIESIKKILSNYQTGEKILSLQNNRSKK